MDQGNRWMEHLETVTWHRLWPKSSSSRVTNAATPSVQRLKNVENIINLSERFCGSEDCSWRLEDNKLEKEVMVRTFTNLSC